MLDSATVDFYLFALLNKQASVRLGHVVVARGSNWRQLLHITGLEEFND